MANVMSYRVIDYRTDELLEGQPSARLVAESAAARPTGACLAYPDGSGTWQYVAPESRPSGVDIVSVYVEVRS